MPTPSRKEFKFAQGLAELEAITAWFESDAATLDEGLVKFERGMELSAQLRQYLGQVENRVEKIKLKFEANAKADPTPPPPAPEPEEPKLF